VNPVLLDAWQSRWQPTHRVLIRLCQGADAEVVGSAVALRRALQDMGGSVVLAIPARLPEPLADLLDLDGGEVCESGEGEFDLLLNLGEAEAQGGTLGEKVFDLLENLGARLDGPVAQALYVAISCATDSFQNDLVTPGTHTRVARLMESGMPADRLARRLFREDSLGFLRLLGKVLAGLRVALGGRLVLGEVSWAELRCSEPEADLPQRLARRIDQVRGGELVVLMCEQEDGTFQVFLRSRRLPAHQVAAFFGGTGGARQARFVLACPLVEARERLLEALARLGAAGSALLRGGGPLDAEESGRDVGL